MRTYPISVSWHPYHGNNEAKKRKAREYNRVAARVEQFLNNDLRSKPDNTIHQYLSDIVAIDLGEDRDIVRSVVSSIDGGSNGVTIVKGDYEKATAVSHHQ
ncbi:dimerization/docking domain-containing protein [Hyphococcus lacteus]|uniref:Uncharacterized protein n=1 Tax=Hyphococcus lacteus TaxID=3143536 RepID=A0ABV3Z5W3_9PROT